jgi:ThiS family
MAGRYGTEFAAVLARSRVWVNGDEALAGSLTELHDGDEVAVLPPVSGGCGAVDEGRSQRAHSDPLVASIS